MVSGYEARGRPTSRCSEALGGDRLWNRLRRWDLGCDHRPRGRLHRTGLLGFRFRNLPKEAASFHVLQASGLAVR